MLKVAEVGNENEPLLTKHSQHRAFKEVSLMSMYRNRYFLLGVLLILLGIQFRMVESFVLNDRATRTLARVTKTAPIADNSSMGAIMSYVYPKQTAKIEPPRWLGLALIAVGSVVSLHALSIPRHS